MNFNELMPKTGSLLLSEPFMLDPNFERAVVLICDHNIIEGTVGFVLNQPAHINLSDAIEDVKTKEFPIYIGGPVHVNALFFIHRAYDKHLGGTKITENLYWGGDFDRLMLLIKEDLISPEEVKLFVGYSGWSANQLEEELEQNSWAVHNSFDTDLTFLADGEDLWKQAIISLGPKYAHVANFPKSPNLN